MRFDLDDRETAWRDEVRRFVREAADPAWMNRWATNYERSGTPEGIAWRKALGARNWLCLGWPREYGGLGRSFMDQWILHDEVSRTGLPKLGIGVNMIAHTLMRVADDAMKAEWLPRIASGEVEFALGYSEPNAGTDLAALRTSAVRDGDSWVINGSKIWNSGGHVATHEWLAVRTDPTASRHRGISIIIVPIDHPGVTVRPITTWGDLRTNELFLDDVRVPAKNLVGEAGRGWEYLTSALETERLVQGETGDLQVIFDRLVAHLVRTPRRGSSPADDPRARDWLARTETTIQAIRLLSQRIARSLDAGVPVTVLAPLIKLFSSEFRIRFADEACQVLGAHGLLREGPQAPLGGYLEHHFRDAVHLAFAGGASEIQRDIIARQGLGLPRSREAAPTQPTIPGISGLDLDDLQRELVGSVRQVRARSWSLERARAAADTPGGHDADLWHVMARAGWLGIAVPAGLGGGGARLTDLAVITEELARGLVPTTFRTTTAAAHALAALGRQEGAAALLERICAGELLVTQARVEPDESEDVVHGGTVARYVGDGWHLRGMRTFVPDAESADIVLVAARMEDPLSDRGSDIGLFAVDREQPGVVVTPLRVTGATRLAEVALDVAAGPTQLLGRGSDVLAAIRAGRSVEQVLQVVDAVGLGQQVLESTVAYMKQRTAFGTVLGAFQAVQHHCANALVDVEVARHLAYDAAWRLSEGRDAARALARAQSAVPEAMKRVALIAHQLHGGIGYSLEHELHLYSNRIRAAELTLGTGADHRAELAEQILSGATA